MMQDTELVIEREGRMTPKKDEFSAWRRVSIELDYDEVFSQPFMQGMDGLIDPECGMVFSSIPQRGDLVFFSIDYGPRQCIDKHTTFGIGTVSEILHLPEKYTEVKESVLSSPDVKVFLTNLMFDDNGDDYEMLKRYRKQATTAPPEALVTP